MMESKGRSVLDTRLRGYDASGQAAPSPPLRGDFSAVFNEGGSDEAILKLHRKKS
jgi:hypothetical protein